MPVGERRAGEVDIDEGLVRRLLEGQFPAA